MKKLFVSVPMRGRTAENIKDSIEKMHKIAEIVFDQELEVIDSYIEDLPEFPEGTNESIYCLGESIKKLSKADYFVTISDMYSWSGCCVETGVAERYGIPIYRINDPYVMMPDALEVLRHGERNCEAVCAR